MSTPHLTPAKLLRSNQLPPEWAAAKSALICFTPFPNGLRPYVVETAPERFFLHSPNSEVHLCRFQDISFIVISEVYGFAVGSTTVEELVYYGIDTILGVGYVGAFNGASVGQRFVATSTISDLPLAKHYGADAFEHREPSPKLAALLTKCAADDEVAWGRYTVWNGNSLYRETPELVQQMKDYGCDVVNMDTLSVYAVAPICAQDADRAVEYIYVGTVTDSQQDDDSEWESDLIEAVNREDAHPHDGLLQFVVETVLPQLRQG